MAKSTVKKSNNLSALLHSSVAIKTGLQTSELPEEQSVIVDKRLNEHLQGELLRIRDAAILAVPVKKDEITLLFSTIGTADYKDLLDKPLNEVIESGITESDKMNFNEEELRQLKNSFAATTPVSEIRNILYLDVPLSDNPILAGNLHAARTTEYEKLVGLNADTLSCLTEKGIPLERIDEATLNELVKDKIITGTQKDDLFMTAKIGLISGGNFGLISAVKEKNIKSPLDLVSWGKEDWVNLIEDKKIVLPPSEESADTYAENILGTIESSFPTEFFLHRAITKFPSNELSDISLVIEPLLKKNLKLFEGNTNEIVQLTTEDLKGIQANKKSEILAGLESLRPIVNSYRYLEIAEIFASKDTVVNKKAVINNRINALTSFYQNNPDINIRATNFSIDLSIKNNEAIDWKGIEVATRPLIQRQMAAFQRAHIMGEKSNTADQLLKEGFDSALRIITLTEENFVKTSGLGTEEGRRVYKKAGGLAVGAAHYFAAIRDGVKGVYHNTNASNQYPLVNDLKEIDGFDELFGSQDFCDCDHCRSVLSPAAYFCDLMYFVQENVSKKVYTGSNASHPLYLKRRRPDLWTLKLTCVNTSTEIPYLQVVNEVLEKYLQTELGIADIYEGLETADRSIFQPFHLNLEELRLYLSHFDINLYDVYNEMHSPNQALHREKLRLSPEQLSIIVTKDAAGAKLRFGNNALNNFNVQDFIGYAGISRSQLDDLLKTTFIPDISQVSVKSIKDPGEIQKNSEQLDNLTDARLDLIHRYLRLWKKTTWTLREFDLLLSSLNSAGLLNNLEEVALGYEKILQLAQLMVFQERLGLGVEELATIIYQLPQKAIVNNQIAFASRIFDLDKIGNATIIDKMPYLLAGLGITEGELQILTSLLAIDLTQPITPIILSDLYRQARIARGLKISIEDLINAIGLVLNGQPPRSLEDIQSLADFSEWMQTTPLKIADLVFIIDGTENSSNQFKNTRDNITPKVLEIQTQEGVMKESDAANKLVMKQSLLRDFLLTNLNLSTDQFTNQFLPNLVANSFDTASTSALNATFTNGRPVQPADFDDLLDLVRKLERYNLLFIKHEFSPDDINFIISQKTVFGINDLKALTLTDITNISLYRELIMENDDTVLKVQVALTAFQANSNFVDNETSLADLWQQPVSLIKSLLNDMAPSICAIDAIRRLWAALKLCKKLGIQGDSLEKLLNTDYKTASGVALGAFASKYPDETIRKGKLEPYADKLNTLKRDALCDYIISREDIFKFKDLTDLYAFFLLDVEMSGCSRTSYLVAAITSLQLYVMRCLTNLEQSDPNLNPAIPDIKVSPTSIPIDEWEWRKNYRVWEANRKVFLYPENYIDPTLRDTQTHLFKELEDELLQQKITKESAEMAYKKYISQFVELTRMRYAGAYYNAVYDNFGYASLGQEVNPIFYIINSVFFPSESDESCYYLFARTNVLPYQYFYRTYNHNRKTWGNWIKIELGIEAKEISVLVHRGRLYIFWTEVKNKELNSVSSGNSSSEGFIFTGFVKYSFLNENGKWSAPQRLRLGQGNEIEQKIYGRARETSHFDVARWEKEKDAIVDSFQEKVFRKPYSHSRKMDMSTPIGLGFIWSNAKSNSTIIYTSLGFSYTGEVSVFKFSFNVPSRSFQVVNNDFSSAVITITISVSSTFLGINMPLLSVDGTIQMFPGMCLFITNIYGFDVAIPVEFQTNNLTPAINESIFRVSLSRNLITNPSDQNIFGGSNISTYKKEYDVAYSEDGSMIDYIENGTMNMSQDKISQSKEGLGGIHKCNGNTFEFIAGNTILTDELADILYARGVEEFLCLKTQEMTDNTGQQFDFRGPYGEYYWEIFFHIPFLIANHFNANQKFKEAKWWYERIFQPTAEESPASHKPTDHNWQFREFRGLTPQKLKDILTDVKAIEVYEKDPFDPHAIARLRISAYQKAIVMRYIDNLLDWGDYLFAQDTRESINEAEMLYRLGLSILGKRPVKMGKCETADENSLTYEKVGPEIGSGSEFLINLENVYAVQMNDYNVGLGIVKNSKSLAAATGNVMKEINFQKLGAKASIIRMSDGLKNISRSGGDNTVANAADRMNYKLSQVKGYNDRILSKAAVQKEYSKWQKTESTIDKNREIGNVVFKKNPRFPSYDLVKQSSMVFCIPENTDLLAYWDRVEDRLFKIWNCMNIKGIRRGLAFFQPPIDPMMLVRLRASGLSLEDIMAIISNGGIIPNYRFTYLVEKAKQYAQIVQSFGSSLLSALEKKDSEELLLLRTVHEKNILRLTKEVKKNQIKEAKCQHQAAQESLANVQNRVEYYQGLIDAGLIPWEIAEQVSKWTAGSIRTGEATMGFLASVYGFLPQIGSPFAMKYGGQELKNGTKGLQEAIDALAAIADNIAILAGMEAGHKRREEEWKQQLKLAQQEYKQVNQLLLAAEIREQLAEKELELHEKSMDQLDELDDFYKNKFTGLGLYNYLASGLNRVYREAYNIAYDLAKLAERAYQFERYDNSFFIQSGNWQFEKAGLLAGDQLLRQLLELERKYIENNVRVPEITQSFSLALLDSPQLFQLRQTGTCIIKIPELAFEIFYPGQFRRVIKSVRITIPCITGPYANISARLTLLKGEIEESDKVAPIVIAIAKDTSITTSSANNDAGLFELNFHDERYLPFEGAGAISEWRLELPSLLRSFNYDTIPDVLIHLSYTSLDGDRFYAETKLVNALTAYATNDGLFRVFSLRYDFPDSFATLLAQTAQYTDFNVEKHHFPYILSQKTLAITETKIYLKPKKQATVSVPASLKVNGNNDTTWAAGEDIALTGSDGNTNKIKGGSVTLNGDPVRKWTLDAGNNGFNKNDLEDVLILIKYSIV